MVSSGILLTILKCLSPLELAGQNSAKGSNFGVQFLAQDKDCGEVSSFGPGGRDHRWSRKTVLPLLTCRGPGEIAMFISFATQADVAIEDRT